MKILVTGGLGYIGSHTVVELVRVGHQVVIVDDLSNSRMSVLDALQELTGRQLSFFRVDMLDEAALKNVFEQEGDIEGIIHFAAKKSPAESLQRPLFYYEQNMKGLLHILKCTEDYQVPYFVFSSSCTVYGEPTQLPVTEETPTARPLTPYGSSKLWSEQIMEEYVRFRDSLKIIFLRYFNPIGAHQSALIGELPNTVPGNLMPYITQTAAGRRKELLIFGNDYDTSDGTAIRDYIHVTDLAAAHVHALEWMRAAQSDRKLEVFNVGTGQGHSVMEVLGSFEKMSGIQIPYRFVPRRTGDIEKIWADTARINQVLDWRAQYDLDVMTSTAWQWEKMLASRNKLI